MSIPAGIITIWSGAIGAIPAGWVLCDGNNGTPNLRNRFVIGAGDTYAVDDSGGSVNHTHDFTSDGHFHTITIDTGINVGEGWWDRTDPEVATGTTDNGGVLPPYYALAYIMKT